MPEILDVTAESVDKSGFFCRMSKMKTQGNQRKLAWIKDRFAEGLRLKMYKKPERGFIEYLPIEHAWRTVRGSELLFIHCLWIVGKSRGKGLASLLLEECLKDAQESGFKGVAVMSSEQVWMAGANIYAKHDFEQVDTAGPAFGLWLKRFADVPAPSFMPDTAARAAEYPEGVTVFRSDQCPYIEDATNDVQTVCNDRNIPFRTVELQNAQDVRRKSPTPYGTFAILKDGEILSYHYLTQREFLQRLGE